MADPAYIYRVFGTSDDLLYVGITSSFDRRWRQHAETQPWWPAHRKLTSELLPTRHLAELAEEHAIRTERPRHNKHLRTALAGWGGIPWKFLDA